MMSDYENAMPSAFRFEIIFRELCSQGMFKIAGSPTFAPVLNLNCDLARGGGGSDNYVRLIPRGDFGFPEGMEAATRARIHLFDEPVLHFFFVFRAFQQRARCYIAMRQVLRNIS